MFDFISYARDMGIEIRILPAKEGCLTSLELVDPKSGFFERHDITDKEAASCGNIDRYTGQVLDSMAARIGSRKAKFYADRHKSRQLQEREKFFRGE